jgi:hypothetical protein
VTVEPLGIGNVAGLSAALILLDLYAGKHDTADSVPLPNLPADGTRDGTGPPAREVALVLDEDVMRLPTGTGTPPAVV